MSWNGQYSLKMGLTPYWVILPTLSITSMSVPYTGSNWRTFNPSLSQYEPGLAKKNWEYDGRWAMIYRQVSGRVCITDILTCHFKIKTTYNFMHTWGKSYYENSSHYSYCIEEMNSILYTPSVPSINTTCNEYYIRWFWWILMVYRRLYYRLDEVLVE